VSGDNRARLNLGFLNFYLGDLERVARANGYALAIHGSLVKDIDLLAVPWVDDAAQPDALADALRSELGGHFATNIHGDPQPEGDRPHGRRSWSIAGDCIPTWVDLSIFPPGR